MNSLLISLLALTIEGTPGAQQPPTDPAIEGVRITETRTYRIRQTVALNNVPASAKEVRMWVPVPADGTWQRVVDRRVVEAPKGWRLVHQPVSNAEMIVATSKGGEPAQIVVETTVVRESPAIELTKGAGGEFQPALFPDELRMDAPLMSADEQVTELAKKACAGESDPRRKVVRILDAVADAADHYSKDPKKPNCGRGSAQDCLANAGGCCTDLHSLFIAAARSQGIPARLQFGYRLKGEKENTDYDPSYRCWVEYYLTGLGWVPTDLVVADAGERDARIKDYGRLDARRVWLWQGRGLELEPRQASKPIETMSCGWAEIDGVAVDVLPAADGSPSKLTRTIRFQDLTPKLVANAK